MPDLPSKADLYKMYGRLRERHFRRGTDYFVPPPAEVRIEWSNRLISSAGVCYPAQRVIRLSTHYHRTYPGDVCSTLLHEMIHLIVPGHGPEFYAWLERIRAQGGRVARFARSRATAHMPPRWRYTCQRCRQTVHRYRRLPRGGAAYVHKGCGGRLIEARLT